MRDGMSLGQAIASSYVDFRDLAFYNYFRRLRGLPVKISTLNNIWAGYWARDLDCNVPELFLYSKTDFYTPYKFVFTTIMNLYDISFTF